MYTTRITRTLEENPGARKVRTAVFMEEQGYKKMCIRDRDQVGLDGVLEQGSHRTFSLEIPAVDRISGIGIGHQNICLLYTSRCV